jgi:predicted DNA-binding protein (UPF0251 family)
VPRPRKRRVLTRAPRPAIYKPAGIALRDLRQVKLLPEELEALRLADLDGLTQAQAAESMGVSRSTFQRILERAHRQVAVALTERLALRIAESTHDVVASSAVPADPGNPAERSVSPSFGRGSSGNAAANDSGTSTGCSGDSGKETRSHRKGPRRRRQT